MTQPSCRGGVFTTDNATAERIQAAGDSLTVWTIDGAVASNRENFFSALAAALHFPDYFGHNWDSTYDCLTDLAGGDASPAVLLISNGDRLLDGMVGEWNTAQRVLADAAAFWEAQDRWLVTILVDDTALPDLPVLPPNCMEEVLAHDHRRRGHLRR